MLVSVFSDASVRKKTQTSSWGAWIKSERGMVKGGGRFREFVECTAVSEASAAVNAVALAIKNGVIMPGDTVLIQTDNVGVKGVLEGNRAKSSTRFNANRKAVPKAFKAIMAEHNLTWRWKHVKGHSGYGTPRTAVNEICDRLCRQYLEG